MIPSTQSRIESRREPSPMAIIGAILAQGAIRLLDRQKREQNAAARQRNAEAGVATSPDSAIPLASDQPNGGLTL